MSDPLLPCDSLRRRAELQMIFHSDRCFFERELKWRSLVTKTICEQDPGSLYKSKRAFDTQLCFPILSRLLEKMHFDKFPSSNVEFRSCEIKRKDKFAYIVKQTPETAVKMRQLPTILLKNYFLSSGGIKSIMVSKEKSTGGQNVVDHGFFRKTFLYYYIKTWPC